MEEFLSDNATALFALVGVLAGSLATGLLNRSIKKQEAKLRLTEKLLDKKLEAHESLITIVNWIRTMVLLGGQDEMGELRRCPFIMKSQENKNDFLSLFTEMQNKHDRWFSANVKREISLFMDYFVNVNEHSKDSTDVALQNAGVIIRNDFIDFALSLENCAHEFFNKDMLKLKYKTDRRWHKYPKDETLEKLDQTEFFKNKSKVIDVLSVHI